ncbi:MAG: hypothetical protein AAFY14_15465 [Pseudomonadota bacterium]
MKLSVTICKNTPRAIHRDWINTCVPDVTDPDMRDAMLSNPRIADRLVATLLNKVSGTAPSIPEHSELSPCEATLFSSVDDGFLRRVGLIWLAPLVAPTLLCACPTELTEQFTRDDLRLVLDFQDHQQMVAPDRPLEAQDFENEGEACVSAWLQTRNTDLADRMRLTVTRRRIRQVAERAIFLGQLLNTPRFTGDA